MTQTFLLLLLTFTLTQSAPQLDSFIKTNHSRPHNQHQYQHRPPLNDNPESMHSKSHRHGSPNYHTSSGMLRGIKRNLRIGNQEKEVHAFYGVPFAKPPLGDLRFKKPVPVENWNGTFHAYHQPNTCYQEVVASFEGFPGEQTWLPNTDISEDCLYMNVWVPGRKKHQQHPKKMPILVWIYGGGYVSGTATLDIYNAEILAAENNVIVVVPQYRVGAFGFLYFGEEDAPGNVGMYDQIEALKWIKKNANALGGDPNSITVFGESAGGGSVTLHLISPVSRDLIDRGIIQSGTINAPWSIHTAEKAREIAEKLVKDCNCTNPDGSKMTVKQKIQCLRELPASIISSQQWNHYDKILQFFSSPTIDGELLPKDPMEMLKEGDYKKAPLLIGSNRDEGTYFILYDFINNFTKDGENCQDKELLLDTINHVFPHLTSAQKEAIRFQYTDWEDSNDRCKIRDKFIEFVGDHYFICPTNRFAEAFAGHGAPVYYYFFTQRTSSNPWGEWMGVMHADEIEYVFGIPLNNSHTHTWQEKELSKRIMKFFTHFAETGNPIYDPAEGEWPLYTKATPNYYILHSTEKGTGKGPRAQPCAFWNEFLPNIAPVPADCHKLYGDISSASGLKGSLILLLSPLIISYFLHV